MLDTVSLTDKIFQKIKAKLDNFCNWRRQNVVPAVACDYLDFTVDN